MNHKENETKKAGEKKKRIIFECDDIDYGGTPKCTVILNLFYIQF